MESIFLVTDRTHRHDDVPDSLTEQCQNRLGKFYHAFTRTQFLFFKQALRTLLAVIHHFTRFLQDIYMIGSERKDSHIHFSVLVLVFSTSLQTCGTRFPLEIPVHRVIYARRIVHDSVWIDHGTEAILDKTIAEMIRKTTAHEKQSVRRLYLKVSLFYVHFRSKVHIAYFSVTLFFFHSKNKPASKRINSTP